MLSVFLKVSVLGNPLLHIEAEPERVDTAGNDAEKEPLDVVAEELSAGTVEDHLTTVNGGVLCNSVLLNAYCPRGCDTCREGDDEVLKNSNTD